MKKTTRTEKILLILFGVVLSVLLLEVGMRLAGFCILSLQESRNRISGGKGETYRILTLGESTTADFGIMGNSWPRHLERILNERGLGYDVKVINKGVAGVNTAYIVAQLPQNLDRYDPHLVITMMGVNDHEEDLQVRYSQDPEDGPESDLDDEIPVPEETWAVFKGLRVYKLVKFIGLHLQARMEEAREGRGADQEGPRSDAGGAPASRNVGLVGCNMSARGQVPGEGQAAAPEGAENKAGECRRHLEIGEGHYQEGRLDEAIEAVLKAREMDPMNEQVYIRLGQYYKNQERFDEAEAMFKRSLEVNPGNLWPYVELGRYYSEHRRYEEGAEMFRVVAEKDPSDLEAWLELGQYYKNEGLHDEAEEMFTKAFEIDPKGRGPLMHLSQFFQDTGRIEKTREITEKAVSLFPRDDWAYARLGWCLTEEGRTEAAAEMFRKADELRRNFYNPILRNNYLKVYRILKERGVRYIAMQYPLRSVDDLRKMFRGDEDIFFVSNKENFDKALESADYDTYFGDKFAGDFGHCVPEGNRLIAENLANVIVAEILKDPL